MSKLQAKRIKQLTPLIRAIRLRCLDCSAGSSYEVEMCVCPECALFPYRCGLNHKDTKTTRKNSVGTSQNASEGEGEI